jgi:predicted esterase
MELPLTTISPSAPHTHTVVFLHGRGDNAQKFAQSLLYSRDTHNRTLPEIFPSFRWVFPQAELRECAAFPGDKMFQWFDVWNVTNFSDHEELQAVGLRESVSIIRRVLASEATVLNGRWDHLVLAGISQGAATSIHTLLNLSIAAEGQSQDIPRRLGAFLGFSCRMPFPGRSLAETRRILNLPDLPPTDEVIHNTPVLLEHCVDDPLVLVGWGKGLRDTLRGFGAQVEWKEYPNGGHWFNSPAGIDDAVEFLNLHLLKGSAAGSNDSIQADVSADSMDLS